MALAFSIGPPVEIDMRASILVFVGGLVLAASTQAAPLVHVPIPIEFDPAPPVELVSGGCG